MRKIKKKRPKVSKRDLLHRENRDLDREKMSKRKLYIENICTFNKEIEIENEKLIIPQLPLINRKQL